MDDRQIVDRLTALAHATRLRVFRLLVQAGPEGLASGDIARRIGIPATTMSTHLAILARAALISARRDSRLVYYTLAASEVRALFDALVSDCCDGRPELCAPLMGPSTSGCAPKTNLVRKP